MSKQTSVHITSGELRGRKISFEADLCHPMGERERLALFNSLSSYDFSKLCILDLFSGSGALGIEALSRGAKSVTLVENNPKLAKNLKANLEMLNLADRATIIPKKVQVTIDDFLAAKTNSTPSNHSNSPTTFDLIFADPPYDDFQTDFLSHIPTLLSKNGIFVLSHPKNTSFEIPSLTLKSTRTYAGCTLSFYQKP